MPAALPRPCAHFFSLRAPRARPRPPTRTLITPRAHQTITLYFKTSKHLSHEPLATNFREWLVPGPVLPRPDTLHKKRVRNCQALQGFSEVKGFFKVARQGEPTRGARVHEAAMGKQRKAAHDDIHLIKVQRAQALQARLRRGARRHP